MTGLDLVAIQDAIATQVASALPTYEIKEDYILDDEQILKLSNRIKPFVVLRWYGLSRSATEASFGGVRKDGYESAVDVILVAPNPRIVRQAINYAMDQLIGWTVPGGGQLIPVGGQGVAAVSDDNGKPHLYLAVNTLSFRVDSNGLTP